MPAGWPIGAFWAILGALWAIWQARGKGQARICFACLPACLPCRIASGKLVYCLPALPDGATSLALQYTLQNLCRMLCKFGNIGLWATLKWRFYAPKIAQKRGNFGLFTRVFAIFVTCYLLMAQKSLPCNELYIIKQNRSLSYACLPAIRQKSLPDALQFSLQFSCVTPVACCRIKEYAIDGRQSGLPEST